MLVLLDTNQVFDDPFLTRPSLAAMLDHRQQGGFEVAVPAVVVDEAVRQYAKHLDRRPARGPQELGTAGQDEPEAGDSAWVDRYRDRLEERLWATGIRVLDEPDRDLVARWRAEGRKPFKVGSPDDDGDARIWATALQAAQDSPVILISRNHRDFGTGEETLHEELLGDLRGRGLPDDRVLLRPSTVRALGDLGAPYVDRAAAADLLERGKGKNALFDRAQAAVVARLLDDESADLFDLGVDLDPETVYVDTFEPERLSVNAAYRLGEQIAVEASVYGKAYLDVSVFRADAYGLPDDSPITIHDYEYNETYAEGHARVELEFVLETTVDERREVGEPAVLGARPTGNDDRGSGQA